MGDENRSFGFGVEEQPGETTDGGFGEVTESTPEDGVYGAGSGTDTGSYGQPGGSYGAGTETGSYGQPGGGYGAGTDTGSYGQPGGSYGAGTDTGSYGQPGGYGAASGTDTQSYRAGTGSYGQPNQQFGAGAQGYGQPNQQFGAGAQGYGQPYGAAGYGQMNYGMGTPPLDKKGRPLKNNFGMKITFSILEILCCCGCNVVTMIFGILGCVFTAQANQAYKASRWDEYRGKAKTASIFLWIGLGIVIAYAAYIGFYWVNGGSEIFWDAYYEAYYDALGETSGGSSSGGSNYSYDDTDDYDYDYDYNDNDQDADSNAGSDTDVDGNDDGDEPAAPAEPLDVTPGEGFTDPSITLEGVYIQLPLSYPELVALGFSIEEEDEEYIANKSEYYYPTVYGPDGEAIGYVYLGNETEGPLALKDCVVFGFWLSSSYLSYDEVEFSFSNGLNQNATKEDFFKAYGDPDYVYESDTTDYQSYKWYNHSDEYYDMDENSLSVDFSDGKLNELDLMYIGW